MADQNQTGILSDETRKIRKGLLVVCLIGFSISKVGLVVKKISILGSELAITRFEAIPLILGLMVLYYLLTFICYGLDEYSSGHRKMHEEYLEKLESGKNYSPEVINENLENAHLECKRLELDLEKVVFGDGQEVIKNKLEEKKREINKLDRLLRFSEYYFHRPFFFRFRFIYFRPFMELFAPIAMGIYTLILLFFFTPIPQLPKNIEEHEKLPISQTAQIDKKQNQSAIDNKTKGINAMQNK